MRHSATRFTGAGKMLLFAVIWVVVLAAEPPPLVAQQRFQPTEPQLLSSDSPTKDEDVSVIRARDGTLFVAWFSDRDKNPDIYITSTRDGQTWTPPSRVTTDKGGDFYPTLIQDDQGIFHMSWFRWDAPFRGHILYNSSRDGLTWDQRTEVQVTTTANVADWVPTITQASNGTLLIYFVSEKRHRTTPTSDIYVSRRRPNTRLWEPAVPVTAINSSTEHDHLPFATRLNGQIVLTWVRYDTRQALPWLNPTSAVWHATSGDGMQWEGPVQITNDAASIVNLFPALYPDLEGNWSLVWLSTRLGPPGVFELAFADVNRYPAGVTENTWLPAGYSHRIAPTSTPGIFLGVWVQGAEGEQDIYYRFFEKP